MNCLLRCTLASLVTILVAAHAHAHEAGWMQIQTAGAAPDAPTTTVALYYPTMATPRAISMGPFALDVAIGGKPGMKVYWTVIADRKDMSAEATKLLMPVEQPKSGDLAGRSLDDNFLVATMAQLEKMGYGDRFQFRHEADRRGGCYSVEVHPAGDRDELLGPADSLSQMILGLFVAQRDNVVRPAGC